MIATCTDPTWVLIWQNTISTLLVIAVAAWVLVTWRRR